MARKNNKSKNVNNETNESAPVSTPAAPVSGRLNPIKVLGLPEPVLMKVNPGEVQLNKQLQHRDSLQDTETVTHYADLMKDGVKFPPIKVLRETSTVAGVTSVNDYVYDGFQRVGGYNLALVTECDALVTHGTFADALFLSLSSNGDNSTLPRTKDDARRSVKTLVENESLLKRVADASKGVTGGLTAAIAQACQVSNGTVQNALVDMNLQVYGRTLRKRPATDPTGTPGTETPATDHEKHLSPEEAKAQEEAARKAKFAAMQGHPFASRIEELQKQTRLMSALVASLVTDAERGSEFRRVLDSHGIGIAPEFDAEAKERGESFAPYFAILQHWSVPNVLINVFKDFSTENARLQEIADTAAEEAKQKEAAEKEAAKAAKEAAKAAKEAEAKAEREKQIADEQAADRARVAAEEAATEDDYPRDENNAPKGKGKGKKAKA